MSRERPKSTERGDAGRQIAKQTVKLSPAPPSDRLKEKIFGSLLLQLIGAKSVGIKPFLSGTKHPVQT